MARDHERYADDVGAYLLGALPQIEREAFERHLMGCAACRDEVERLRPAVDALPRSVPQVAPPPTLKTSLMEAIERELGTAPPEQRRDPRSRLRAWFEGLGGMRPGLAWGMAALLLAIGGLAGFGLSSLGGGGTRAVPARVDATRVPGARASLWVPPHRGGAILRVQGLPTLPRGRVYEVWLQRDGAFLPESTFQVDRRGTGAAAVPEDLRGASAVLVTREPRGGSRAPTEAPIVSARL
jgi:anti-sigma-K factor RskA